MKQLLLYLIKLEESSGSDHYFLKKTVYFNSVIKLS